MGGLRRVMAAAIVLLAVSAGVARAADEEIQVYEDDLDKPGKFGLDTHLNYVPAGDRLFDYVGQQQSVDRIRVTPEWSYGLTKDVELGLYLPLADFRNDQFTLDGYKMRVKYINPHPESQDWYWGANFEIGQVDKRLDINPWNAELKGILGWRKGRWDLAFNTNIDWAVSGPDRQPASIQLATKVSYKLNDQYAVGVESYDGAGDFNHLGRFGGSGHEIYGAVDATWGKWAVNAGVGYGYSGEPDRLTLKMILTVPIDE
jgi:hypothetical protein